MENKISVTYDIMNNLVAMSMDDWKKILEFINMHAELQKKVVLSGDILDITLPKDRN